MQRREYLAAIATIMGVSGCIEQSDTQIKSTEQAMEKFTEITEFETPDDDVVHEAVRFTDEEAGVVFWGFRHQAAAVGSASQLEIVSRHKSETDL